MLFPSPTQKGPVGARSLGGATPHWGAALGLLFFYLLAAKVEAWVDPRPGLFVRFWLPSGVYVGYLIVARFRSWPLLILAACTANFFFDVTHGRPALEAIGFLTANTIEAVVGAFAVRKLVGRGPAVKAERELVALLLGAACLGPLAGASAGTAVLGQFAATLDISATWSRWWLGDFVGVVLMAPVVIMLHDRSERSRKRRPWLTYAAIAFLAAVALWFTLLWVPTPNAPWRFVLILLVVWAGLRLAAWELVVFNLVFCLVATGLFLRVNANADATLLDRRSTTWVGFIGGCGIVGIALAMFRRESGRHAQAFQHASERLKLAHSFGKTGAWEWDFVSGRIEWSEQHSELWGMGSDDGEGDYASFTRSIHPDDLPGVEHAIARARETGAAFVADFRIMRPNGAVRWMAAQGEIIYGDQRSLEGMTGVVQDITERKRAEQALQESELMLNAIVDSTKDYVWSVDAETFAIHTFNRAIRDYFRQFRGVDLHRGHKLEVLFSSEEYIARWRSMYRQTLAEGLLETEYRTIAGDQVLQLTMHPLRREGRVFAISVFGRDVTAQRAAEEAMRENEQRFRGLFQNLDAIAVQGYAIDGTARFWNQASEQLYGYTAGEAIGRNISELICPKDAPCELQALLPDIAAAGASIPAGEVTLRRKDGSCVSVYSSRIIVQVPGHEAELFCLDVNLTDLRAAEQRLTLLHSALEAAANTIVITNREGELEWVNTAFTASSGYAFDEVAGKTMRFMKSGQHDAAFYTELWTCILSGKVWRGEIVNQRKDGTLFHEEAVITPVRDGAGEISHFVAVKQDVTGRKNLEAQVRQTQKMEAIGQLAGGIAHDFNNVLAATMLNLNLLQREPQLSTDIRASLKELELETRRAAGLTRQLLLFSRRQVLQIKSVEIGELVANLTRMLRHLIGENITFTFASPTEPMWIEADTGMIEQVVMNLCVNARDAMPDGGNLSVQLRRCLLTSVDAAANADARAGAFIAIEVSDTGCGMDASTLKQLFVPFFTTKQVGKGTGLGLATVYGIVRQHRGWVTVVSAVNVGTTFTVFLPELPVGKIDAIEAQPLAVRGGDEAILLVEDDAQMRRMVALTLESYGYRVLKAANATEALAVWAEHAGTIDLLLTDMVMPGKMSGRKLAAELRRTRPRLPVLVASGYTTEVQDSAQWRDDGIEFISKPFRGEALALALRKCLDQVY